MEGAQVLRQGQKGQLHVIYGLLAWTLWSEHVVFRFSTSLPFIFFVPLCPLHKSQITEECWLSRKQSFRTLPKSFDHLSFSNNTREREKENKSQNSRTTVIVVQWIEFPVWIISAEPLRQGQLKETWLQTPFIHEGLGCSVSRRVALLDLRAKHLSYWGIRYPIMGQAIPYRPPVVMGKWP